MRKTDAKYRIESFIVAGCDSMRIFPHVAVFIMLWPNEIE